MAPSAVTDNERSEQEIPGVLPKTLLPKSHGNGGPTSIGFKKSNFNLTRNIHEAFPLVTGGKGNFLFLADGRTILDASSGAAVSCLGHGNERVIKAITDQINTGVSYLCSSFWSSSVVDELCEELINGTDGEMDRVYLTGSGMSL